jgi:membrane fusion protein (multidrug efflux system)
MQRIRLFIVLAVVVAGAVGLWFYWQYSAKYPSTADAYVGANIVSIAPQLSGQIASVAVREGSHVRAGDELFTLNSEAYQNAKTQAQANLSALNSAVPAAQHQVDAATASVTSAQAALSAAQAQFDRDTTLQSKGDVAISVVQNSRAALAQAQAAVDSARAGLASAQAQLIDTQNQIASARAQLATAELDLSYATVTAPADGIVANLGLRQGAAVAAFQPLFALVETGEWWVDANFKETDLPRIRPGQPASVAVDLLPGQTLKGTVETISPGSGSTFALLPAENASGNWVKVTQRFAVRIRLEDAPDTLHVGASATVTVDTVSGTTGAAK